MRNVHGDYALISNELSKYNLESTPETMGHYHHEDIKTKIGNELILMEEMSTVIGIKNL